jgi:hypothetical protein
LDTPSADISTIRARRTSECGKLRERAIERSRSASAALTATTTFGLPMEHRDPAARARIE